MPGKKLVGCFLSHMARYVDLKHSCFLAEDLGFVGKGEIETVKQNPAEIERMLKALLKTSKLLRRSKNKNLSKELILR